MKVFINKGVNFDEVEEILSKVNTKNVEPNLFVKAKVEEGDVTFYTMEGNEILFTLDSTVLKGWEKLYSEYIGIINIPNKSFEFTVFSELHTHSEYSILDGANKISDIAKKYPYSGALTDHGVIYGWVEFYKAMKKNYKHPLMGCEVYTKGIKGDEGKYHLILLAMNEIGANNIIRISSEAQEHENYGGKFPQRPLVSYDMLEKYSEGVICLSACMGGEVPRKILANDTDGVVEVLTKMKSIFGENYYLEIQRHGNEDALKERIQKKTGMTVAVAKADAKRDEEGFIKTYGKYIYQDLFYIEEENKVNDALLKYSKDFDIKIVATNDAHYLNKEDASTHEALLCNQTKKTMTDINHWSFSGIGYHIHTSEEMEELFKDIPEALINTLEVSNKCNYEMEFGNYKLPKFDIPAPFKSEFEYLKDRAYAGYESRYSKTSMYKDPERIERMKYELSVIEKMGYASYFLIVWDFIRYAKENGIAVGPGRGSAAGSLVCYCLGITELDPIPYNLLFERFLNPDRISMPDIDIDFQENRREEVIDYCKEKYGDKSVASIITFGTMAARKIVEDMCRVYDISDKFEKPNKFAEYIKSFIPMEPKMTLKKAMDENPEFRAVYETNENVKFIVDESKKLEGLKRNVSTHACGKVICNGDINQYCPTVSIYDKDTDSWQRTAAWNMTEIEEIGLLKMDFLGLKTMTLLQQSIDSINEIYGKNMTISDIPLNDVETYQYIAKGNTVGVFQLESSGMTSTMMQMYSDVNSRVKAIESMKITEEEKEEKKKELGNEFFERLIAGISLYRPGPMDSIPAYITGMLTGEIHYDTPELESILSNTYGQLVYQEQVIQTVQKLAGFTPGQADSIRKAMGKKKQDIVDEYGPYFIYGSGTTLDSHTHLPLNIKGCVANGIEEATAQRIWDKMYDFAKYAFNKSHAAAYAVNSIRTAWLACHYPEIFRKSLLNVFIINQDKVKLYLSEIVQKDIPLLPPSVNYSEDLFSIENKTSIRFGLGGIKRVKKLALAIQDERKERGFFSSYRDFVERIITYQNGNKAAIESLVLAGALDDFNGTRKAKIAMIEPLIERLKSGIEYQVDGQSTIFQLDDSLSVFKDLEMPNIEEYDENTMYFKEEEVTGLFITGHPLDKYLKTLSILGAVNLSELLSQEDEITGESIPSAYLEKEVFISGILSEVTSKNSKSGKMFTFKLKDRTSEIRCVAFNKILTTYGEEIFKDNQLVTIHGKLTNNEFGDQIIVQTIGSIDNLPTDIKEIEIIVSNDFDEAKKQGIELEKALKDETGDTVVYCSYENKNGEVKKWNPSQFSKIHISYSVFSEIQRIVGERNVILK